MLGSYLGVILDQHLSWNEHIKQTANKATIVNAFLHRNLYQCPSLVKSNVLQNSGQAYYGILIDDLGPPHISKYQSFGICPKTCCKNVFQELF